MQCRMKIIKKNLSRVQTHKTKQKKNQITKWKQNEMNEFWGYVGSERGGKLKKKV